MVTVVESVTTSPAALVTVTVSVWAPSLAAAVLKVSE